MLSERRAGFGGSRRAEIDFHCTRRQPRDGDIISVKLCARDCEAGTSPILARRRQITHGDENSFDANYAHDSEPV
jgi:hypothetical protein